MYGLDDCPVDLAKLRASIKEHEGLRLIAYRDSQGFLTIGYGRNISSNGISRNEAEYLLSNDIQFAVGTAEAEPWWPYVKDDDVRARAFIEIGFNIGFRALRGFRDALDAASRGDWPACAAAFLDSLWHKQTGRRAETLATMILTGKE